MNFLETFGASASGLSAQRLRMNLISSNLANVNSTRTPAGGPYRRKDAVFAAVSADNKFARALRDQMRDAIKQVQVTEIREDNRPPIMKYDPNHPDADQKGYVALPNINVLEEMVNMLSASRSYEANVTAVKATKQMVNQALEIGR
jgi:flagellar basal-body rod protein FlgC